MSTTALVKKKKKDKEEEESEAWTHRIRDWIRIQLKLLAVNIQDLGTTSKRLKQELQDSLFRELTIKKNIKNSSRVTTFQPLWRQ